MNARSAGCACRMGTQFEVGPEKRKPQKMGGSHDNIQDVS